MTHPNSSNNYDKEVHQESYTDGNGNIYQTKQTTETINSNSNPDAYRHGYIHGQAAERSQRRRIVQRDEDNTSRGLLLGSLLATIAILAGGFLWYINQRDNDVTPVTPIIVPNANKPQESPSPSPSPTPQSQTQQESKKETTIIEKVREVPVPVPVPQPEAAQPPSSQTQSSSQPTTPQQQPSGPQTEININPVTPEASKSDNNPSESNSKSQTDTNSNDNTPQ
ncbi:hypothetical protein [Gloeothece verrucosa]|uniref:Uncharacterized protein n=1 Tax=Gloeothece verrucosa (strain PCC 7822) TaxID=497965 RepID=E0U908_GLOV7|nr:hypothetical protein [Gloeothece verrucosa]ADN16147.1 conserved hypothetical protein [Gloeothece verrucosa PCC 7822]